MDSWKTKHLFPAMGMIPVDRSGGDAAQAALDAAAEVLDQGRLFMIYPEGTRSRSGNLHKGRTGAARLALRCNAPIIPTGHEGTVDVQPPDTFVMKPRKHVVVRFGAPMWAHEYGDPDDPRTLRRFTDAVMFEIAQLSGQQYVDTYAGKDDRPADATKPSAPLPPRSISPSPRDARASSARRRRPARARSAARRRRCTECPRRRRPAADPPALGATIGPVASRSHADDDDDVARIGVPPGRRDKAPVAKIARRGLTARRTNCSAASTKRPRGAPSACFNVVDGRGRSDRWCRGARPRPDGSGRRPSSTRSGR